MKKLFLISSIVLLSLFATTANASTIWQVAAPADLYTTYNNALFLSGDEIELTTSGGAYTWGTKLGVVTKSFALKTTAGLASRPVITLATPATAGAFFQVNNSTANVITISFDGVEFVGNANITAFVIAGKTKTGGDLALSVNDCKFTGFTHAASGDAYFSYSNSYSSADVITKNFSDLTVTNSIFIGGYSVFTSGAVSGANHFNVPNNIIFTNNFFKSITGSTINSNVSTLLSNSLKINHCTFDGCTSGSNKEISVGTTGTTGAPTVIKNTLFANRGASTTANICGAVGSESNVKNAVYYTGSGAIATIYPTASLGDYVTAGFNVNPTIDATSYVATAAAYLNAGSDGKTIGYYGNPPVITASNTTLSGFSYDLNSGPSEEQSFTVLGSKLTADIVLTAPANYEISTTSGTAYTSSITLTQSAGAVASTTIYVRLKAGLLAENYANENIVISTTGTGNTTIACSGTVTNLSGPTLNPSKTALADLSYVFTYGPSAPQTFYVNGMNLSTDITVTPPASGNFEISNGGAYTTGALTVASLSTVSVRLVAGLAVASYGPENIVISAAGATSMNLACSGTVGAPTVSKTRTSLTGFSYLASAGGPSAEQSFLVSGHGLNSAIELTAPTHYEISLTSGTEFTSSISLTKDGSNDVSSTSIYVRLKAGLPAGAYNLENLAIATNGMTTQNIPCSGSATMPTITLGRAVLVDRTYAVGNGPSAGRDCTVSGTDLLGDITVTCPAYHEISTSLASGYQTTPITLTQTNGVVSATIYTRLAAGLLTDKYTNVSVSFESTGATTKTLALTSNVTGGAVIWSGTSGTAPRTALSGSNYAGAGPGVEQTLVITGDGLSSDVTITPSANFEVSLTTGTGFTSTPIAIINAGTLAATTIYIRLKAGMPVGAHTENITISAAGANTRTVAVTGVVTSVITTGGSSLVGFKYGGNGPSAEKSITVKGTNTVSSITVTAPTHYEISATSGSGFGQSPIVLASVIGDSVPTTPIYVRLKAGLAMGTYNTDTILVTNANATTRKLACNGSVVGGIFTSTTAVMNLNYIPGGGPSPERSFTVAATDSLKSDLLITPPANFEISLTSGSGFQTTPITLTQTLGSVATTTIYVRLIAGLTDSNYNGTIDITATGVTAVAVALSGTVDINVPINEAALKQLQVISLVGSLKVVGARAGEIINVYNVFGQHVKSGVANEGDNIITLRDKGFLLVNVGLTSKKVSLR